MAKNAVYVMRGKLHWAKVFGEPRLNEYSGEKEWSFDFTPDVAGKAKIKEIGASSKLKEPKSTDTRKETFIAFRHRESREDRVTGERIKNEPLRVVDAEGNLWDTKKLLGNDTIADVKFAFKDNGKGKQAGMYAQAIRVLKLVPYTSQDFAPLSEEDEFFGEEAEVISNDPVEGERVEVKKTKPNPDDLDDDIPF